MKNFRLAGINCHKDVEEADPEVFRINGPVKALFYKLLPLIRPPSREVLDRLSGNAAIDRDIYYEYLGHEQQQWRREVLTRVIPFSLALETDTNYEEFVNWYRFRMFQRRYEYTFRPHEIYPQCWLKDNGPRMAHNGVIMNAMKINRIPWKELEEFND